MNFKSEFLQELQDRGFISQITNAEHLDSLMATQKISVYIGFDCTAESLHVGSLIQIMILRLLQKHGHTPIALLGGGTTKIGDPSGKDESRQILTEERIAKNLNGIKNILAKFILFKESEKEACEIFRKNNFLDNQNFSYSLLNGSGAQLVNNDDWLKNLNYIEFLRDVGKHFSVNRMLTFDSVKLRLERDQPLSFLEFNYMILQAYDFYELNKKYNCRLQIGGSDQWGNIVNGVELTRRIASAEVLEAQKLTGQDPALITNEIDNKALVNSAVFGLTSPLLTTADGKKMGKTADGAVWLDAQMLSPFDYFQYFRNSHDNDVVRFLKLFTDLKLEEIANLETLRDQEINKAKEILAFEATKICHGEKSAQEVLQKAREIFISKNSTAYETKEILIGEGKKLIEIIKEIGAVESNAEAKRLIEGRGIKINKEAILDINQTIKEKGEFELSVGKKKFFKIIAI